MARDFADFLEDSMRALEREAPAWYRRVGASLGDDRIRIEADGAPSVMAFRGERFGLSREDGAADFHVGLDRQVVLDLVEGRASLDEAIQADRLSLRGAVDTFDRFYEALLIYFDGALRSPSFPALLDAYRSDANRERRFDEKETMA